MYLTYPQEKKKKKHECNEHATNQQSLTEHRHQIRAMSKWHKILNSELITQITNTNNKTKPKII